jgi:hypothetical protein
MSGGPGVGAYTPREAGPDRARSLRGAVSVTLGLPAAETEE